MMMPDMDGRAVLQRLKVNSTTNQIPAILVTAKVQSSDRKSFAELDVVAVFAKPFRPLKLADEVTTVLAGLGSAPKL
ncbi:response regulator [Leptolyngbya sp. FACHB-261]|uniref:response regulator n=1 Tax=Leptolyngbya sp. FACHB-261 TaxID=2692806 RepID=UPI001F549781|nr:response regulator [Leptolyngbya sp. FACHB-261]